MAVYTRGAGSTFWVDVKVGDRRVRRSTRTSDLREARRIEAAVRARLLAGEEVPEPGPSAAMGMSCGDAWDRIWRELWATYRSGTTYYHALGEGILRDLGPKTPLREISTGRLQELVELWRARGNRPRTLQAKLAILRSVLRRAHRVWKVLPEVPDFRAVMPRQGRGRLRWMIPEEEVQFLEIAEGLGLRELQDFVVAALDTGARRSELLALERRDLDLGAGTITLWRTKTDSPRTIPLTARARAVLERRVPFTITHSQLTRQWNLVREAMGLQDDRHFTLHCCRHAFASRLVQRGVQLRVVQELLGHASIVQTMRYSHLQPANLVAAIGVLEAGQDEGS